MAPAAARLGRWYDIRYSHGAGVATSGLSDIRQTVERRVFKCTGAGGGYDGPAVFPVSLAGVIAGLAVALIVTAASAGPVAADDFPFVGKYTQNVACKGDGTDAETAKVTISPQEIVSNVGVCTILDTKRTGNSILAHVECKFAGGPLMGDITFTPRPDNTVEFVDRDNTYKALLYPCPK